jgi:hypothetical protein
VPWLEATRRSAREELPILVSVLPPSVAVLSGIVLEVDVARAGWLALLAALGGQVFWTWLAVRQAGTTRGIALLSLAVSSLLGLALVGLKLAISH